MWMGTGDKLANPAQDNNILQEYFKTLPAIIINALDQAISIQLYECVCLCRMGNEGRKVL